MGKGKKVIVGIVGFVVLLFIIGGMDASQTVNRDAQQVAQPDPQPQQPQKPMAAPIPGPREKLNEINAQIKQINNQEDLNWRKWKVGDITAMEYFNKSRPLVLKVEDIIAQMEKMDVPAEWKDAYRYYRQHLLLIRDAYEKKHRYAVDKERGNFPDPDVEAHFLSFIADDFKKATEYLELSQKSRPKP